jgi:outer membrane immunogenic protein
VVGAGIEKAADAHWRVKAEYPYMDFGSRTFIAGSGFDTNIRLRENIARVGFNYRFPPD